MRSDPPRRLPTGRQQAQGSAWAMMSAEERSEVCRQALATIGVSEWTETSSGEWVMSCPLPFGLHAHGDAKPSAALSVRKGLFCCLACNNGGSLAWLVATCTDRPMGEVVQSLSGRSTLGVSEILERLSALWSSPEAPAPLPSYSPAVLAPWMVLHPYVTEVRKVPVERAIRFAIGFDEQRNRVVIPHFWRGRLVGWQSRRLGADGTPKYLSSPDFPRARTIFNFQAGVDALVVESPMSVLVRSDHPHPQATFGAAVSDAQLRLLESARSVTLAMDNDPAGWGATEKIGRALIDFVPVWVVANPFDADMADLSADQFARCMGSRVPFALWRRPEQLLELGSEEVEVCA